MKKEAGSRSDQQTQGIWSGRVFVGIGRALYIGGASDTTPHLHHAIQICMALSGQIRLRSGPESTWKRFAGAIIRSDQGHQLDGSGHEVVIAYIDPESEEQVAPDGAPIEPRRPAPNSQAVPGAGAA